MVAALRIKRIDVWLNIIILAPQSKKTNVITSLLSEFPIAKWIERHPSLRSKHSVAESKAIISFNMFLSQTKNILLL